MWVIRLRPDYPFAGRYGNNIYLVRYAAGSGKGGVPLREATIFPDRECSEEVIREFISRSPWIAHELTEEEELEYMTGRIE